jgi:hypothetical protein
LLQTHAPGSSGRPDKEWPFEFILTEPAKCPNCRQAIAEKTLIEPLGGIEVDA